MTKRFARNIEDFICENCGHKTTGNGYTNHCPECLHSKHVDINPGDRQSRCQGLMEPIAIETKGLGYAITFKCTKCGAKKRCKSADNDSFDTILTVMQKSNGR